MPSLRPQRHLALSHSLSLSLTHPLELVLPHTLLSRYLPLLNNYILYCLREHGEAGENNGYVKTISENYTVLVCSTSYPITTEHPNENLIVEINHFIGGKN